MHFALWLQSFTFNCTLEKLYKFYQLVAFTIMRTQILFVSESNLQVVQHQDVAAYQTRPHNDVNLSFIPLKRKSQPLQWKRLRSLSLSNYLPFERVEWEKKEHPGFCGFLKQFRQNYVLILNCWFCGIWFFFLLYIRRNLKVFLLLWRSSRRQIYKLKKYKKMYTLFNKIDLFFGLLSFVFFLV